MSLLPHHRDHLRTSGLSDSTIEKAGIYSVEDPAEAARLLNWSGDGGGPVPAIAFPALRPRPADLLSGTPAGDEVQGTILRPDVPRTRANGHAPKYEHPIGVGPMLSFAPTAMIPVEWWNHKDAAIVLTEGTKKCLAIAQAGFPAISAMGVDSWHDQEIRKADNRFELHASLRNLVLPGRHFYIAFDGGDTTTNLNVINAEARLARMLLDAGAIVHLMRIPADGEAKVGIDDHLAQYEDELAAIRALMSSAVLADPVLRSEAAIADPAAIIANAQALLADRSFAAGLRHAPKFVLDGCFGFLEKAKVTRASLVAAVEAFRASLKPQAAGGTAPAIVRSDITLPAVRAGAQRLLEHPQLMNEIIRHLAEMGLVGEQLAATALMLIAVSRRTQAPLHAIVKGASGGGKNQLVACVSGLIPASDRLDLMELSPHALQNLPDNLDGKLITIEEIEGGARAEYPLRAAMSKYELTTLTAQKVDRDGASSIVTSAKKISTRSSFVTTTTRARVHDENESRTLEITLDESREQTNRILDAQARLASTRISADERRQQTAAQTSWQAAFDLLEPFEVVLPDVDKLRERFDGRLIRHRRDLPRALGLAKARALLHQRQRNSSDSILTASREDVEVAARLVQQLGARESPRIMELVDKLQTEFGARSFTSQDAARVLGYSRQATNRNLKELEEEGLVETVNIGKGSKASSWQLPSSTASPVLQFGRGPSPSVPAPGAAQEPQAAGGDPTSSFIPYGQRVPSWAAPSPAPVPVGNGHTGSAQNGMNGPSSKVSS